mmetsp:Transcript_33787/g.73223  ORF Transcript_33787/g.73223 Transcript_33787/m.73223 type:complete len:158 (-) Transcript_33787:1089-1562(-)
MSAGSQSVGFGFALCRSLGEVEEDGDLSPFGCRLMGCGVGAALCTLLFIRYMHYGNKKEFTVANSLVVIGTDARIDRIVSIWWWTIGVACITPFAFLPVTMGRPLFAIAFYAVLLLLVCVLETSYSDYIGKRLDKNRRPGEEQAFVDSTASYQGATK